MLPFLVGRLGDKWYGIWTILGSFLGYYYLIDFGLATAVSRYVTKYTAKSEHQKANVIINTSLAIYVVMAFVIIILTTVFCYFAGSFVSGKDDLRIVRIAILIMGTNLALEFPFKAFAGIIGAYVRYELLSISHFFTLLLSTGLIVFFIWKGYGIIALAVIGFVCTQISNVLFYLISKHLFSEMEINKKYFQRDQVKKLFNYSIWSFIIKMGDQLRLRIDSLVIGFFLSAVSVTHYFIGARLVDLFMNLTYRATNITTPVFTKYHALGDYEKIRNKLLLLSRLHTIIASFGGGLLIIIGRPFIIRWVGEEYLDTYPILVVLILGIILEVINNPSNNVLYALSKHRYLAVVNIIEGFTNLTLSIILIQSYGIIGVAFGTALPIIITRIFVLPSYMCRCIDLPVKVYFMKNISILLFTSIYLVAFYLLTNSFLLAPQYGNIAATVILSMPLYGIVVWIFFLSDQERKQFISLIPQKFIT